MLSCSTQCPDLVTYETYDDPVAGPLLLGFTKDKKLCRLSFIKKSSVETVLKEWKKEWAKTSFQKTAKKVFKQFSPNMDIHVVGTDFQQKVWLALLTITKGKTISYGALAKKINKPKATRAIGTALGKNPLPLILPCHRVIRSDGSIGGFGGGVRLKQKLINFETETI